MRPVDVNGRPLIYISAALTMSLSGDGDGGVPASQFATKKKKKKTSCMAVCEVNIFMQCLNFPI